MENKMLIDLAIKYGLDTSQLTKVTNILAQCEIESLDEERAKKIANFMCEKGYVEMPAEELIEILKKEGLTQ